MKFTWSPNILNTNMWAWICSITGVHLDFTWIKWSKVKYTRKLLISLKVDQPWCWTFGPETLRLWRIALHVITKYQWILIVNRKRTYIYVNFTIIFTMIVQQFLTLQAMCFFFVDFKKAIFFLNNEFSIFLDSISNCSQVVKNLSQC